VKISSPLFAKEIALRLGEESASASPVLGKASASAPHRAKGSQRRCPFVILFGCGAIIRNPYPKFAQANLCQSTDKLNPT
jgi:hypothetical protein